ncbi:hypothetical protein TNCV_104961 [Trichonephila clavipes]|nr:hypothetical protein TNCV_104961 [Trichonephila clavipes]
MLRCLKISLCYKLQPASEVPQHKRDHSATALRCHRPPRGIGIHEELSYHPQPYLRIDQGWRTSGTRAIDDT